MQISTRGRYAVRILLDVAMNGAGGAVRMQDISARQGITPKYAEQITALLVKTGLLRSLRGAGGGYSLVKPPSDYRISEILLKTEGDLVPVDNLSESEGCAKEVRGALSGLWSGLHEVIIGYLDSVTLQNLLECVYEGGDHYVI